MKKVLTILLIVALIFSFAGCKKDDNAQTPDDSSDQKQVLKVGMECNYAPFNWTQTEASDSAVALSSGGYADGYDVQIAKLIADGLGMDLEIVKIEWDGLTLALQTGEIDLIIAGMSPTEDRKMTIDFTDNYYESELVIVVKADSEYANATSLSDFSGAKITGQLNTFHYSVIDQIEGVDIQSALDTFPTMIVALKAGSIDGYVSEKPGALSAVAANPELSFVEFAEGAGFVASQDDTAIAVGLLYDSEYKDAINQILAGITQEQREQLMLDALNNQPLSE